MARKKKQSVVEQWQNYFQKGDLADWQRLCRDLGLADDLPSKTKCREALKSVNINIKQFLNAQSKPTDVMFFASKNQLFQYTLKHNAFYPRRKIKQGDPLGSLLKEFF